MTVITSPATDWCVTVDLPKRVVIVGPTTEENAKLLVVKVNELVGPLAAVPKRMVPRHEFEVLLNSSKYDEGQREVFAAIYGPDKLKGTLTELAGAASMCWDPRPTGVFDSTRALGFVEEALKKIEEE